MISKTRVILALRQNILVSTIWAIYLSYHFSMIDIGLMKLIYVKNDLPHTPHKPIYFEKYDTFFMRKICLSQFEMVFLFIRWCYMLFSFLQSRLESMSAFSSFHKAMHFIKSLNVKWHRSAFDVGIKADCKFIYFIKRSLRDDIWSSDDIGHKKVKIPRHL